MATKTIRDLIYVDNERVHSLYSQVFGGIADLVVKSHFNSINRQDTNSSIKQAFSPSLETNVLESSSQTENTVLHDELYRRLELKIKNSIVEIEDINANNFRSKLQNTFLIKIRGKAEIEDYERLAAFTKRFNKLAEAIVYSNIASDSTVNVLLRKTELIEDLEDQLKCTNSGDKQNKERITSELNIVKKFREPHLILRLLQQESGMRIDPQILDYYSDWFEFFHPKGFEITIMPLNADGVVFRGVLDRNELRLSPEYLRSLFGNYVDSEWVMVGQVTYLPDTVIPEIADDDQLTIDLNNSSDSEQKTDSADETSVKDPLIPVLEKIKRNAKNDNVASLRDPVNGLAKRAAYFDRMFFESAKRKEIIMRPLAIYREFDVEIDEESEPTSDAPL